MWMVGRSAGEPRKALAIDLPPGVYFAPRSYDMASFAALARLLCDACTKASGALVMTWSQADALEALGRTRGDSPPSEALWALYGNAGAPLPFGGAELKALVSKRYWVSQPRWVVVLDPEAPASALGWLEAHVKMPLLSWLKRTLSDERHPLRAAAIDQLDVDRLASISSDPLELIEILEGAVSHRLTYAFSAGIPSKDEVSAQANVGSDDWRRSVTAAAAQRLARRINKLDPTIRKDALDMLGGSEIPPERRDRAVDVLVRALLLISASSPGDKRSALARAVLDDEEGRKLVDGLVYLPANAGDAPKPQPIKKHRETPPDDASKRFESMRQAASATVPPPASDLADFAASLADSGGDPARAEQLFEQATAAEPENVRALEQFAMFLWRRKRELDRAEVFFERAITAGPTNAVALNNFAKFLRYERRDLDRAETLYERAIVANPQYGVALDNYANFLWKERHARERAERLYEQALTIQPKNANALANSAHMLFLSGKHTKAIERLHKAITRINSPRTHTRQSVSAEIAYYRAVHLPHERDDALRALHTLITQGARSPGWDLRSHAQMAEEAGDWDAPLLFALAKVLSEGASPSTLLAFPRWNDAVANTPS